MKKSRMQIFVFAVLAMALSACAQPEFVRPAPTVQPAVLEMTPATVCRASQEEYEMQEVVALLAQIFIGVITEERERHFASEHLERSRQWALNPENWNFLEYQGRQTILM